jgi:hypothetical protein
MTDLLSLVSDTSHAGIAAEDSVYGRRCVTRQSLRRKWLELDGMTYKFDLLFNPLAHHGQPVLDHIRKLAVIQIPIIHILGPLHHPIPVPTSGPESRTGPDRILLPFRHGLSFLVDVPEMSPCSALGTNLLSKRWTWSGPRYFCNSLVLMPTSAARSVSLILVKFRVGAIELTLRVG